MAYLLTVSIKINKMQTHTPYIDPGIKLSVEQFGR